MDFEIENDLKEPLLCNFRLLISAFNKDELTD